MYTGINFFKGNVVLMKYLIEMGFDKTSIYYWVAGKFKRILGQDEMFWQENDILAKERFLYVECGIIT